MSTDRLLDIVIVTSTGARKHLEPCLASLERYPLRAGGMNVHVVDNASADGTAEMVRRRFPDVQLTELDWNETTEVIPAAVTALVMPFTYSIANGLAFGFITYAVLKLFTGRAREVHAMVWVIAAVFLFKFAYVGGH